MISSITDDSTVLSWDEYFMATAFLSAQRSAGPDHRTGACVVNDDNKIVSIGYKGLPQNIHADALNSTSTPGEPPNSKHWFICHAAMNAILNKNQQNVLGCRMYCTHLPCNECAKIIIQAGIRRIIYANDPADDCVMAKASRLMFSLVGVSLVKFPRRRNICLSFLAE